MSASSVDLISLTVICYWYYIIDKKQTYFFFKKNCFSIKEKFEDTKGVIRNCKLKKKRQPKTERKQTKGQTKYHTENQRLSKPTSLKAGGELR